MEAENLLNEIANQVKDCTRCALHHNRKNAVPGEGPADSALLFIGEGPGFHENEQGRPFVGQAGKLLEEMLASVGLKREQVFIANVVKCRPPSNRDPLPEELVACSDYLDRQIAAIKPRVIVTLGRFSMAKFLPMAKISEMHGKSCWVRGQLIVPFYHPAAALHQPSLRPVLEADFKRLPDFINQSNEASPQPCPDLEKKIEPEQEENPTQLSLF